MQSGSYRSVDLRAHAYLAKFDRTTAIVAALTSTSKPGELIRLRGALLFENDQRNRSV